MKLLAFATAAALVSMPVLAQTAPPAQPTPPPMSALQQEVLRGQSAIDDALAGVRQTTASWSKGLAQQDEIITSLKTQMQAQAKQIADLTKERDDLKAKAEPPKAAPPAPGH